MSFLVLNTVSCRFEQIHLRKCLWAIGGFCCAAEFGMRSSQGIRIIEDATWTNYSCYKLDLSSFLFLMGWTITRSIFLHDMWEGSPTGSLYDVYQNVWKSSTKGGWSFRVKICPNARSPKVTHPPSKYLHGRCNICGKLAMGRFWALVTVVLVMSFLCSKISFTIDGV